MTPKDWKILCALLAAGEVAWIWSTYKAWRLVKIKDETIEMLEKQIKLNGSFATFYKHVANDAIKSLSPNKAVEITEAIRFHEITQLGEYLT